jgi:hypothetical protein
MWEIHYTYILKNENRAELWPLYLAYDIEIRKRSTQTSIDPSVFSIGIWNDLETRYTAKKYSHLFDPTLKITPVPPQLLNRKVLEVGTPVRLPPFGTTSILIRTKPGDASSVVNVPKITCPVIAPPPATPAGSPVIYTGSNLQARGRVNLERDIVTHGMALPVATKVLPADAANIGAHYAAPPPTTLNSATLSPSLLVINTPFVPNEWERLLNKLTPFNSFPDVPIGMRFGFDMGVHSPPAHTFSPPNHNSALLFPDHVSSHIRNELSLGRYSGPFSQSRLEFLIGPFRTSPLGTVPKALDSTERRIVQDLSFPRNDPNFSSVNDQINIEDFRCDWGTFNEVRNIVIDAPPGSEAATLDVDAAFRCCPITPSQQRNFVIHWNGLFFIDHNAPFGATSAGGVFGRVADAMSAILESKHLGPRRTG